MGFLTSLGDMMRLTSPAFANGDKIPSKFTCDGNDVSPELRISGVSERTKCLVLIMDDSDAPVGIWDHWVVFNISPEIREIGEDKEPQGVKGKNSWGRTGYGGPCPPDREHRYFFKLYALDIELSLNEGATKKEIEQAMEGHILEKAELMGRYKRKNF